MSQLDDVSFETFASGVADSTIQLEPASQRNGLFTLKSDPFGASDGFVEGESAIATFSVRPGRSADLVNGIKRIKRKFTMKLRLPVPTPGLIAGAVGSVTDYIDVDFTIATPVEATLDQLYAALSFVDRVNGVPAQGWVEEMLVEGKEPY